MQKTTYAIILACLLSACAVKKGTISNRDAQRNNQQIRQGNRTAIAGYTSLTSQQYIDRFKTIAVQEMNLYGIPASITLAQGLFESGSGNSDLAKYANNHFGIKCTSDWKGKGYYKDDDAVNDCFRVYDKPEDSFRDHSEFLKRKRYIHLFELDKNDYQGWAHGLKAAGYATNPNYPQLIINIIQKYQLYQYDQPEGQEQKIIREEKIIPQIEQSVPPAVVTVAPAVKDTVASNPAAGNIYVIKQGDTLYNISKRFGLTVDELKALNGMTDNTIKIGQKLVVTKQ